MLLIQENCAKTAQMSFGINLIMINSNLLSLTQFGHKLINCNLL